MTITALIRGWWALPRSGSLCPTPRTEWAWPLNISPSIRRSTIYTCPTRPPPVTNSSGIVILSLIMTIKKLRPCLPGIQKRENGRWVFRMDQALVIRPARLTSECGIIITWVILEFLTTPWRRYPSSGPILIISLRMPHVCFSIVPIWRKPTWVVWHPIMSQAWKRCLSAVPNLRLSICGTRTRIISWKMWRKRRRCSEAAQAWISWPSRGRSKQKNLSQCLTCSMVAHRWPLLICQLGIWIMW